MFASEAGSASKQRFGERGVCSMQRIAGKHEDEAAVFSTSCNYSFVFTRTYSDRLE
jgi:hypothetical protein